MLTAHSKRVFAAAAAAALSPAASKGFSSAAASADIERFSSLNPKPLSLEAMIQFGQKDYASEKASFEFLRHEMPVRLANIMKELQVLPEPMKATRAAKNLNEWYLKSFEEIVAFEKANSNDPKIVAEFTGVLGEVIKRHATVLETLAESVAEVRPAALKDHTLEKNIQYFVNRFLISRISIRMLLNQHNILFGSERLAENHPNHIGAIDPACDVSAVVKDASLDAKFMCEHHLSEAPEVKVICHNSVTPGAPVVIPYVPSHLYYILFEMLKNAMRATVEHHSTSDDVPHIEVLVVMATEDVTLRIADQGGGIKRSMIDRLFRYVFSTAGTVTTDAHIGGQPLMAGYGFGLPLSRLFARYFRGDLVVNSVEGYGTNVVVFLKTLSTEASELLPTFNKTTFQRYKVPAAGAERPDWSGTSSTAKVLSYKTPKKK